MKKMINSNQNLHNNYNNKKNKILIIFSGLKMHNRKK